RGPRRHRRTHQQGRGRFHADALCSLCLAALRQRCPGRLGGLARASMSDLTQLGRAASIPPNPDAAKLERVANPHAGALYLIRFTAPEFTSLCPVTAQPDFATLVLDYAPRDWIVE